MRHARSSSGFTLIELSIVVTMIGVLAAIAAPRFLTYLQRARQAEPLSIMPLIAAYEEQYKLRYGAYIACAPNPARPGGQWNAQPSGWTKLGFSLHGDRLYSYEVAVGPNGYIVKAAANLDDDATLDQWESDGAQEPRHVVDDSIH